MPLEGLKSGFAFLVVKPEKENKVIIKGMDLLRPAIIFLKILIFRRWKF